MRARYIFYKVKYATINVVGQHVMSPDNQALDISDKGSETTCHEKTTLAARAKVVG
ncbi:hypothetical protein Plhal304r1_c018g0064491 [Plasmopara halstedii]